MNSEKDFYLRLATQESLIQMQRYFETLAKFAQPKDRERNLIQAEEFREYLLAKDSETAKDADTLRNMRTAIRDTHLAPLRKAQEFAAKEKAKKKLSAHVAESQDFQLRLDAANSLSDVGTVVLENLMQQAGIDPKWLMPLKKRLKWVDGADWTLQSAADLLGSTRERLRQVVRQLDGLRVEAVATPRALMRVLGLAERVGNIDELFLAIREEGLAHTEDHWSKESLLELFHVIAKPDAQEALARAYRNLSAAPRSRRRDQALRAMRSKHLGTFDLSKMSEAMESSSEDLIHSLKELYKHVYVDGQYGIAIGKPPGTFVSLVGRQMLVNPDVSAEELFEGISRYERYRGMTSQLSFAHFHTVLNLLFGETPSLANLPDELSEGIALTEFETAAVGAFQASGRSLMHRDELEALSSEAGISPISAGVYLSNSPVIRPSPVRRGYYRLV